MKKNRFAGGVLALWVLMIVCSCSQPKTSPSRLSGAQVGKVVSEMTELMVHDITNPPLAARFFSYACLSGYEIVAQNNSAFHTMNGYLAGFPLLPLPDSIEGSHYQVAAVLAMLKTAGKMQPSGSHLAEYEQSFLDSCRQMGYTEEMIEASERYATSVSKAVLAYAKEDHYNKISNKARYTPVAEEGHWYPTPPAYLSAVEPYFNTVRPFYLDSASQFRIAPPVPFSKEKNSPFYKLLAANYHQAADSLTEEHREIALYWDCNPFAVQDDGHLMVGLKKISPGAHWLGITGIVCQQTNKSFDETMFIHTMIATGLMDSFLACWDEKYRSNRIRPETAIRQLIDVKWKPLLQTPPFPEYLSGHSCVSATSAVLLSHYIGNNVPFTDTVEMRYGLPARRFASFTAAAEEAAISRFYGGIHFTDAIEQGLVQGKRVGEWIITKMEDTPPQLTHR